MSNTKKVTKQEALDYFIDHIMKNKKLASKPRKPENIFNQCFYNRRFNGGCAIGHHIPLKMYKKGWEGKSCATVFLNNPEVANLFEDSTSHFWILLQRAHDATHSYMFEWCMKDLLDHI